MNEPYDKSRPGLKTSLAVAAFEQHRLTLHRFLMRRLRHRDNAQDLAQEVYLRLLRVDGRELIRDPLAFLYRIALNLVYEFNLHRSRERVVFDSDAVDELAEQAPEGAPSDVVDKQLATESELKRVLLPLPPMIRAVFILRKRDGMSDREIAAELGLSVHTVKKYLCQAVAQCRQVIAEQRMEKP